MCRSFQELWNGFYTQHWLSHIQSDRLVVGTQAWWGNRLSWHLFRNWGAHVVSSCRFSEITIITVCKYGTELNWGVWSAQLWPACLRDFLIEGKDHWWSLSHLPLDLFRDNEFLNVSQINTDRKNVELLSFVFFLIIFPWSTSPLLLMSSRCPPNEKTLLPKEDKKKKKSTLDSLGALCYDNFIVDSLRKRTIPQSQCGHCANSSR